MATKIIIDTTTREPLPTDSFQAGLFPFYRGNHTMGNLKEETLFYYLENTVMPYLFVRKSANKKATSGIENHLVLSIENSINQINPLLIHQEQFEAITLQCECNTMDISTSIRETMCFLKKIVGTNAYTKPLFIELNPQLSIENYLIIQRTLRLLWADCIHSLNQKLPLYFTQVVEEKMSESAVMQQILKTEWGENATYRLIAPFSKKWYKKLRGTREFLRKESMIHPTIDPLGGSLFVEKKAIEFYETIR